MPPDREKIGDIDQQFLEQAPISRMLLEVARIHLQFGNVVHRHAPFDAPSYRGLLVLGKIVAVAVRSCIRNAVNSAARHCVLAATGASRAAGRQHFRHFFHRQHMTGVARLDSAFRHAVVFALAGSCTSVTPPHPVSHAAQRASVRYGQHDAIACSPDPRQRTKKGIDRHALPRGCTGSESCNTP